MLGWYCERSQRSLNSGLKDATALLAISLIYPARLDLSLPSREKPTDRKLQKNKGSNSSAALYSKFFDSEYASASAVCI